MFLLTRNELKRRQCLLTIYIPKGCCNTWAVLKFVYLCTRGIWINYSVFTILEYLRIGARKLQNSVNHMLTWDVLECRPLWRLLSFSSSWNNHWFYLLFIFFLICPPPSIPLKIKETAFILCKHFRYDSSYNRQIVKQFRCRHSKGRR